MQLLEHCPDVLTISEAAEVLKISTSAIRSLVDDGEIEHVVIADQPLIFKLFLIEYIEKLRHACYSNGEGASNAPQGHLDNHIEQDIPPSEGDPAMAKYKLTKAQDQMAMILINLRTAYATSPDYAGLNNAAAISLNIVPSDMLPGGTGGSKSTIKNAFGGDVTIAAAGTSNTNFTITYDDLGKEACVSLLTSDWGTDGLVSITMGGLSGGPGDKITVTEAVGNDGCETTGNSIVWTYY